MVHDKVNFFRIFTKIYGMFRMNTRKLEKKDYATRLCIFLMNLDIFIALYVTCVVYLMFQAIIINKFDFITLTDIFQL